MCSRRDQGTGLTGTPLNLSSPEPALRSEKKPRTTPRGTSEAYSRRLIDQSKRGEVPWPAQRRGWSRCRQHATPQTTCCSARRTGRAQQQQRRNRMRNESTGSERTATQPTNHGDETKGTRAGSPVELQRTLQACPDATLRTGTGPLRQTLVSM